MGSPDRDAGHGLIYQYPSEFNRAIIIFLEDNHEHKELKNPNCR